MVAFSKGGSVTALRYEGTLPELHSEPFGAALSAQRFRTIETAASEAESAGWVTINDPTGDTFDAEDLEHGPAIWLRVRMDKKTLPARWVQIYRTSAERAAGRKLSVRERRELKEDLMDKLLPRVLPTVRWVDALLFPERKLVLLMSTSAGAIEAFQKLFLASFSTALERCDPLLRAQMVGLDRDQVGYLDQVAPVRWPGQDEEPRPAPAPRAAVTAAVDDGSPPFDAGAPAQDPIESATVESDHEANVGGEA